LIAHHTATVAGVAANPNSNRGVSRLERFKGRRGPFLLLADSVSTALRQARFLSPALRKLARKSWPGPVTLIFPAKPGLPSLCYKRGRMAIRVDADPDTRMLARKCGGLLLSSSLNRRGGRGRNPSYAVHMRWHQFLSGRVAAGSGSGTASQLYRVERHGLQKLR